MGETGPNWRKKISLAIRKKMSLKVLSLLFFFVVLVAGKSAENEGATQRFDLDDLEVQGNLRSLAALSSFQHRHSLRKTRGWSCDDCLNCKYCKLCPCDHDKNCKYCYLCKYCSTVCCYPCFFTSLCKGRL